MNSLTPYTSYCSTRSLTLSTHPVWVDLTTAWLRAPKARPTLSIHPVWVEARLTGYAAPKPHFPTQRVSRGASAERWVRLAKESCFHPHRVGGGA